MSKENRPRHKSAQRIEDYKVFAKAGNGYLEAKANTTSTTMVDKSSEELSGSASEQENTRMLPVLGPISRKKMRGNLRVSQGSDPCFFGFHANCHASARG